MTRPLQRLIDALRDELQQYGELLALLDAGQDDLTRKTAARASRAALAFQGQAEALVAARAARQKLQQQLAWSCQRPDAAAFSDLLPLVPSEFRPLLRALVEENESLHRRIAERAGQGHPWLNCSSETIRKLIATTSSPAGGQTAAGECATPANVIVPGAASA